MMGMQLPVRCTAKHRKYSALQVKAIERRLGPDKGPEHMLHRRHAYHQYSLSQKNQQGMVSPKHGHNHCQRLHRRHSPSMASCGLSIKAKSNTRKQKGTNTHRMHPLPIRIKEMQWKRTHATIGFVLSSLILLSRRRTKEYLSIAAYAWIVIQIERIALSPQSLTHSQTPRRI